MRRAASSVATAVALCATVGVIQMLRAQQPPPDLVLTNGKVVTVDERFTIAQGLAVRGERIVAVGSSQEMAKLAGPGTRNAGKHLMCPGARKPSAGRASIRQ